MKKRFLIVIGLILGLILLAGCGSTGTTEVEDTEVVTETAVGDSTIVCYYSATGNTKKIAEDIATDLECPTFEITPEQPYTEEDLDYNNPDSRISQEMNNQDLDVKLTQTTPDDWDTYDTVFLGYPIWNGGPAYPMEAFVVDNDFAGKTVIPFCTSGSSGIEESENALKEATVDATWEDGMRFAADATPDEVASWLADIGY